MFVGAIFTFLTRLFLSYPGQPLPDTIDTNAVFSNNEIKLSDVEVYGFDYDYTLAGYSETLQDVIFNMGKQALVKTKSVSNIFILVLDTMC